MSSLKSLNKEFKGVGNDLLHECWIVPSVLITLGPIAPIFSLHSIFVKSFERVSFFIITSGFIMQIFLPLDASTPLLATFISYALMFLFIKIKNKRWMPLPILNLRISLYIDLIHWVMKSLTLYDTITILSFIIYLKFFLF